MNLAPLRQFHDRGGGSHDLGQGGEIEDGVRLHGQGAGRQGAQAEGWTAPGAQRVLEKISCEPQYLPLVTALLAGVYASGGWVHGPFWVTGGVDEIVSNEPYWEEADDLKAQIARFDEESAALETEKVSLLPQLEGARAAAAAAGDRAAALNVDFHKNETEVSGAEDGLRVKHESLALSQSEGTTQVVTLGILLPYVIIITPGAP